MVRKRKGKLVVFEGIDGSGKSSVFGYLENNHIFADWIKVREIGGTEFADCLYYPLAQHPDWKMNPLAMVFGFNAARADLYKRRILLALKSGVNVLEDRSWWTTLVYQVIDGAPVFITWLLCMIAIRFRRPDLTILFDVSVEKSKERIQSRKSNTNDRFDQKGIDFRKKARWRYFLLTKLYPRSSVVIDTSNLTQSEVVEKVLQFLRAKGLN